MVAHSKATKNGAPVRTKAHGKPEPSGTQNTKRVRSQYERQNLPKQVSYVEAQGGIPFMEDLWESLLDEDILKEVRRLWEKHGKVRDLTMVDLFAGWAGLAKVRRSAGVTGISCRAKGVS